jgi:transcriptional regulator with XRE-family HTH domain
MNTGKIIKLIRVADGLGQGELAQKLNISRTYLCQIENGRKQPSLSFLKHFSQRFSIPLPLLVLGEQIQDENNEIFHELREIFVKILTLRESHTKNNPNETLFGQA